MQCRAEVGSGDAEPSILHRPISLHIQSPQTSPLWYCSVEDEITKFIQEYRTSCERIRQNFGKEHANSKRGEKIRLAVSLETVSLVASQSQSTFERAAYVTIMRIRQHIGPTSPVDTPVYKAVEKAWSLKKKPFCLIREDCYEGRDVHKLSEQDCLACNYISVRASAVARAVNHFSLWVNEEASRLIRNGPRGFRFLDDFEEESSEDEIAHPFESSPSQTPRSAFTRSPLPKLCYCVFRSAPHGINPIMESHGATFIGNITEREEINGVLTNLSDYVERAAGHNVLVVTVLQIADRIPSNELATEFAKGVLKPMTQVCELAGKQEAPLVSTYKSEVPKGGVGDILLILEDDKIKGQLEVALRKASEQR